MIYLTFNNMNLTDLMDLTNALTYSFNLTALTNANIFQKSVTILICFFFRIFFGHKTSGLKNGLFTIKF